MVQFQRRNKPYDYTLHEHRAPTFGYRRGTPSIRLHAARDLYYDAEEPIYAIADGTTKRVYEFYLDTYAIEVEHNYEHVKGHKLYVRYGEVSKNNILVKVGEEVKQGDQIAEIGLLYSKKKDKYIIQPYPDKRGMLHLEMYTGEAKGKLTDKTVKYTDMLYAKSDKYHKGRSFQRRKDLFDPLPLLKIMYNNSKSDFK